MFGRWGWYLILDSLADSGRFDRNGFTPLESAMISNYTEAMIWYAKEKNVADQQTVLRREAMPD